MNITTAPRKQTDKWEHLLSLNIILLLLSGLDHMTIEFDISAGVSSPINTSNSSFYGWFESDLQFSAGQPINNRRSRTSRTNRSPLAWEKRTFSLL
jgi:hypothetical protein